MEGIIEREDVRYSTIFHQAGKAGKAGFLKRLFLARVKSTP